MVTLATERLLLRPFRRNDAADFTRLAGDWAVASMTSDIPYPLNPKQAVAWLRPGRGEVRFAIELDGRLIGGAGYYRRRSGAAELGFWLGRPWWGRGYATEAAHAALDYCFEVAGFERIISAIDPKNARSIAVAQRLGMEPDGTLEHDGHTLTRYAALTPLAEPPLDAGFVRNCEGEESGSSLNGEQ